MTNDQTTRRTPWTLGIGHSLVILVWSLVIPAIAQSPAAPLFATDFQSIPTGPLPADFKILAGDFVIAEEGSNRFLELRPGPLNSFGVLIGPERSSDTSIRARVRSWPTGKRFPEFGVGLGGAGGFRLILMPAIGEIHIRQGDKILARAPFTWTQNTWTQLQLDIRPVGEGRWRIIGKAWNDGTTEPAEPMIRLESTTAPLNGRGVLWATPYSEKPIQFDDVRIEDR